MRFVDAQATVVAISSHAMRPPVLEMPGLEVIAATFLRHPVDRARSIWEFNRRRPDDVPLGALAKRVGLAEYLELGLAREPGGDRQIAGHQTRWLARGGSGRSLPERARDTLNQFTVVGLVEEYAQAVERLQRAAIPWFPGLRLRAVRANSRPVPVAMRLLPWVRSDDSLEVRLRALLGRIGPDLYARLEDANRDDLTLWEDILATFR
jgi:hypothetical protein